MVIMINTRHSFCNVEMDCLYTCVCIYIYIYIYCLYNLPQHSRQLCIQGFSMELMDNGLGSWAV
jgi:hypothetical protein